MTKIERIQSRRPAWSIHEAAVALGLHPVTVKRMVASGRLDSVKVGGRRYVTHAGILRHLESALRNPSTRRQTVALLTANAEAAGVAFDPEQAMADAGMIGGSDTGVEATPAADPFAART